MYDINLIQEIITSAGKRAMRHFRKVKPTWKENKTYVTEADLEVQAYLKEELERRFPDDGMIAEENDLSTSPRSGDRYWIIDPIDGTASFARGFPVWGIAIGLLTPSEAIGGFFYMPTTGDFYYTRPDGTVWRNEQQIPPFMPPDLFSPETVLLAWPKWFLSYKMSSNYVGKIRTLGSSIAHLSYAATGSADATFVEKSPVWDVAAGLAMLHHNHGVLEYFDGTPISLREQITTRQSSQAMLAGHPEAVKQYREFLSLRSSIS